MDVLFTYDSPLAECGDIMKKPNLAFLSKFGRLPITLTQVDYRN